MTPLHDEHAAVVRISNRMFELHEATWRRWLAFAESRGMTLLALIHVALRELRNAASTAARETGEDFSVVTWEWRQAIVSERPRNNSHNLHSNNPNDCASLSESNREIGGSVRTWRL